MKRAILLTTIFTVFAFGYLEINEVVGKSIDVEEARYYRIFTDVPGFESARFIANADSVLVEINTLVESLHETRYKNIDTAVYLALDRYIKYFKRIVEDPEYRLRYMHQNKIGWPVVSDREFAQAARFLNDQRTFNKTNCLSAISSGSAYAGGLLGRKVTYISEGCITEYYYSIDPYTCLGVTAGGTLVGYLLMPKDDKNKIMDLVLQKDILAFDLYQRPITAGECMIETKRTNQCLFGTGGFILGIAVSSITFALMAAPYFFYNPNSGGDAMMTIVPMFVFSFSELTAIMNLFNNQGKKQDLKATIERIKQKRYWEHLKEIKKTGSE